MGNDYGFVYLYCSGNFCEIYFETVLRPFVQFEILRRLKNSTEPSWGGLNETLNHNRCRSVCLHAIVQQNVWCILCTQCHHIYSFIWFERIKYICTSLKRCDSHHHHFNSPTYFSAIFHARVKFSNQFISLYFMLTKVPRFLSASF